MVRPTVSAPAGIASASLRAARNEFESFQVVVSADDASVTALDVRESVPLTSQTGVPLSSPLTIYRQGYYNASNGLTSDGELGGATGQFADALIPKVDPWYGEARNAFPVSVPAGQNRAAWIDVFVPANSAAGRYSGSVEVLNGSNVLATIPVTIDVADWTLPATSTIRGGFDLNINKLCVAHDCNAFAGGQRELAALYTKVALDNRMSLVKPAGMPSGGDGAFNTYTAPAINGGALPGVTTRLKGAQTTDVYLFAWDPDAADDYKRLGAANGFLNRISFYCDELNTSAALWSNCANAYNRANALWKSTAPTGADLPLTITSNIASVNWARLNGHNALVGRITTLVPLVNHVNPRAQAFPGQRHATSTDTAAWTYDRWTADGRSLWMYQSCASMGCTPNGSDVHNEWVGWPSLGIDQPASQARAMSWLTFSYKTTGEYYYETAKQLQTAWSSQWDSDGGNHGDGTLFYPGRPNGATGIPAIGGTRQIPIESIRMKRIRDSREDYEYLNKARELGKESQARTIALELFPSASQTTRTQSDIDLKRDAIAALLPGVPQPMLCAGKVVTIVGTAGNDVITGTAGSDVIAAGAGNDHIRAGGGDDVICGEEGSDTLDGGGGNDTLDGGAGTDYLEHSTATKGVSVNLSAGTSTGVSQGTDVIIAVEDAAGTPYADTLVGTSANNFLAGLGGADTIDGRGGADYLSGGAGNDKLNSRSTPAVKTKVFCGSGADVVTADSLDVAARDCETVNRL
jgi:Ca2+-binding RTX toxin-like protein